MQWASPLKQRQTHTNMRNIDLDQFAQDVCSGLVVTECVYLFLSLEMTLMEWQKRATSTLSG